MSLVDDNNALDAIALRQQRKHKFVLYSELGTSAVKSWLVERLLGAGEQSAFYGKPGSGKSVLVGDLGLHVAAGKDWHRRRVRQGAVIYFALERYELVKRRTLAFRLKHNLPNLPFAIMGGLWDLRDERTATKILEVVREVEEETRTEVVLIIVDTISRALNGGDENAPKDMGALVRTVGKLQDQTKAHILLVHHIPTDGSERLRGHGSLLGGMDTTIHVEKLTSGNRKATVAKANDSEEGEQVAFMLESIVIGEDEHGEQTTAPVVLPADEPLNAPRKEGRLTKSAQTALRALVEAIDEQGKLPPASNHIPPAVKIVSVPIWRQQAYRRGISTSDEERARQQAFKRASEYLIGVNRVGIWDGSVWLTG